nr:RNA-directed DNA polymerase, eukaryota, reverse transcriptase zinc-binding domain protein [Tanacetum cinerariifolium]
MEAQYGKFLDLIRSVRINVPLVDILAGMRNYGKFLKELVSNKHKLEQIFSAFLSDESSAIIQNKVPPKLGDLESFLIPCTFSKTFSYNAMAGFGVSINLMPYSLYTKLSLKTLKPTKMSDTCFSIDEILKEDFNALLDEEVEDSRQAAVRVPCGMDSIPPWLIDVTSFITPISKGKTMVSILSRLVLAATSYYIWLERNGRLFKKKTSSPDQIVDVIISMVRLKLVTFKFKKMSTQCRLLLDQWKIPSYCIARNRSSR